MAVLNSTVMIAVPNSTVMVRTGTVMVAVLNSTVMVAGFVAIAIGSRRVQCGQGERVGVQGSGGV